MKQEWLAHNKKYLIMMAVLTVFQVSIFITIVLTMRSLNG